MGTRVFRARFPALSVLDYPGLHFIAHNKAIQDRESVAAGSESRKLRRFVNKRSLPGMSAKSSLDSYTGMGGSQVERPLPYSADELNSRVLLLLRKSSLSDVSRIQLILGAQASSREWWLLKTRVITSSRVHDVLTASFAKRAGIAQKMRKRALDGANGLHACSSAATLERGLAEEPVTIALLMSVMPSLNDCDEQFTSHEVGVVQHPSDVCCASSPDAVAHVKSHTCWFCKASSGANPQSLENTAPRGSECRGLACIEVKFHAGENTQHQTIHELLKHHKISTVPKTTDVAFGTASSWNFHPHVLPDNWSRRGHVIICDIERPRYALFAVQGPKDALECTPVEPVMMHEDKRCCAALKKPWMNSRKQDAVTKLSASAYMHQSLWHMFCTGASTCVFAARSNKQMMVEVLYWDEWAPYVVNAMLPAVRGFVTEVVLPYRVVGETGLDQWTDWVRQPIVSLSESSQHKSWNGHLKDCSQHASKALLTDSENDTVQTYLQCMTCCEAEMGVVLATSMACALDWAYALDTKINKIGRLVAEGEELQHKFRTSLHAAHLALGMAQQVSSGSKSVKKSDVNAQALALFKRKYSNKTDMVALMKPQLRAHGWGGRGGKHMPQTWEEWYLAVESLQSLETVSDADQVAGAMPAEAVAPGTVPAEESECMDCGSLVCDC